MTETLIQPTFTLDLRTIPPRERHPLIFGWPIILRQIARRNLR